MSPRIKKPNKQKNKKLVFNINSLISVCVTTGHKLDHNLSQVQS